MSDLVGDVVLDGVDQEGGELQVDLRPSGNQCYVLPGNEDSRKRETFMNACLFVHVGSFTAVRACLFVLVCNSDQRGPGENYR